MLERHSGRQIPEKQVKMSVLVNRIANCFDNISAHLMPSYIHQCTSPAGCCDSLAEMLRLDLHDSYPHDHVLETHHSDHRGRSLRDNYIHFASNVSPPAETAVVSTTAEVAAEEEMRNPAEMPS
jgi:hypothetical protein